MSIEQEIEFYNNNNTFLRRKIVELARVDSSDATQNELFLAEALAFRTYRAYERFARAVFLDGCISTTTTSGKSIVSKLRCHDWQTAEDILKVGSRFLDWGNPEIIMPLANLVFDNGFPVVEVIGPVHSTLVDLRRVRNFIAHDSKEAANGFRKAARNYVQTGVPTPDTAGMLLLSRKRRRESQAIRKLFDRVAALSVIYSNL